MAALRGVVELGWSLYQVLTVSLGQSGTLTTTPSSACPVATPIGMSGPTPTHIRYHQVVALGIAA